MPSVLHPPNLHLQASHPQQPQPLQDHASSELRPPYTSHSHPDYQPLPYPVESHLIQQPPSIQLQLHPADAGVPPSYPYSDSYNTLPQWHSRMLPEHPEHQQAESQASAMPPESNSNPTVHQYTLDYRPRSVSWSTGSPLEVAGQASSSPTRAKTSHGSGSYPLFAPLSVQASPAASTIPYPAAFTPASPETSWDHQSASSSSYLAPSDTSLDMLSRHAMTSQLPYAATDDSSSSQGIYDSSSRPSSSSSWTTTTAQQQQQQQPTMTTTKAPRGGGTRGVPISGQYSVCPYPGCGKVFARNRVYNLRAHLASHNNVKPFQCEQCERAFSRKHDLIRHIRTHVSRLERRSERASEC